MYALVAIGYSLVYGILGMINFAHGEVMMVGSFAGYFLLQALKQWPTPTAVMPELTFLNAYPWLSVILAFAVGMTTAATTGYFLEKIAYRPLRNAPRSCSPYQCDRCIDFPSKCCSAAYSVLNFVITQTRTLLARGTGIGLKGQWKQSVMLTYTGYPVICLFHFP